jgi:hypothetical protein
MEHRPFPPNATNPPQSRFPWPLIGIILAAVLLGVIIWLIPNSSNKAATSALDSAPLRSDQLRVSEIRLAQQDIAGAANVDVYGQATNTSTRIISQAVVSAAFKDKNGTVIYEEQQPVERVELKNTKDKDVNAKALEAEPIRPGQTVGFRVRFSQVPATWNHEAPEVTVSQVTEKK